MKKVIIMALLLLTATQSIYGFPFRFVRLIKTNASSGVEKTVDLIFDAHIAMVQPAKKTSQNENVIDQEWAALTATEKELLSALETLAAQSDEKIDLIWEWSARSKKVKYTHNFLTYAGKILESEFAPQAKKQMRFVFGDTYRNDVADAEFFELDKEEKQPVLYSKPLERLTSYLDAVDKAMEQDIEKHITDENSYVRRYFENYRKNIKDFKKRFDLNSKNKKTFGEWLNNVKKKSSEYEKFLNLWLDIFITNTVDLEMLIRILSSDAKHEIVYAEGDHCNNLIQALESFGFSKVTDIGNSTIVNYMTALMASAWQYLQEDPKQSAKRVPIESVLPEDLWQKLDRNRRSKVLSIITDAMSGSNKGKKELQKLIAQGRKAYIDLVNMQDIIDKKTLLHLAAERNIIPVIELLLKYGALTDIQDEHGNTPLHYAQSGKAVRLLLNHGAYYDIVNQAGQMPLHVAILNDNTDVARALLEKGADPNSVVNDLQGARRALAMVKPGSAMEKLLQEYGAS